MNLLGIERIMLFLPPRDRRSTNNKSNNHFETIQANLGYVCFSLFFVNLATGQTYGIFQTGFKSACNEIHFDVYYCTSLIKLQIESLIDADDIS